MTQMDVLTRLMSPPDLRGRVYGPVIGIVTNNQDPDGLGRVKVKFPWLSDQDESHWARVLSPMAGPDRGLYFLPEVDDEVLVAFEQGQIEFPYILGALWNGQDSPPATNDDGANNQRLIKSRSGHVILLDDTDGEEKIIIRDQTQKNEIVIDSSQNTISLTVEQDLIVEAKGNINLSASGDVVIKGQTLTLEAQQDTSVTGMNLALEAQQNCDIKANVACTLQANANVDIKGPAGVKVNDGALEVI